MKNWAMVNKITNLGRFGIAMVAISAAPTAGAGPLAASVASPPLVAIGVLVGLALLALSLALFVRTVRTMRNSRSERPADTLRHNVRVQMDSFRATGDRSAVGPLIDALRELDTDEERQIVVEALSELSGRYFGIDVGAWQAWWRREGASGAASTRMAEPPAGEFLPVS